MLDKKTHLTVGFFSVRRTG